MAPIPKPFPNEFNTSYMGSFMAMRHVEISIYGMSDEEKLVLKRVCLMFDENLYLHANPGSEHSCVISFEIVYGIAIWKKV